MVALTMLLAASAVAQQQDSQSAPASGQSQKSDDQKPQEQKKPKTADENPFPEDISKKAAQADKGQDNQDQSDPTVPPRSDAARDSNSSSSNDRLQGVDVMGDKDKSLSDGAGGVIFNPKLAAEDVHVGGFYLQNGNFQGAYERFKEANLVNPGNADAVFGLAEAARGLKKTDEAIENYQVYLDAFPTGKKSKDAVKALKALSAAPKP
jgi:tetratricopeptide (TPR) repeat protein